MKYNTITGAIVQSITPVSIEVFYEDQRPYIKYIGITELNNGMKVQVEIPKMDLVLNEINREEEVYEKGEWNNKLCERLVVSQNIYVKHDQWCNIVPLERICTKKELEKELGYKLNIKN